MASCFFLGAENWDFAGSHSPFHSRRYWNWFDLVLGATGLADLTIQLITRDSALVCPRYGSFFSDVHIEGLPPGCRTRGGKCPGVMVMVM